MSVPHVKISVRKKAGMMVFRQYVRSEASKHQLNYLMWECTLRCNYQCLHCGSDCKKDNEFCDMPAADFLKVADEVAAMGKPEETMIVITGGEPLMRADLAFIGAELHKRRFPWGIVTNGHLLSQNRLNELIAAGLRSVSVSLDGFEASHEWLRGVKGSFDHAINAIVRVAKSGLVFDVVTCVNQRNYAELNQLRLLLIQLGVKRWRLFTIFPSGRAKYHDELTLDNIRFKGLFNQIKDWRTSDEIHVSYGCEGFLGEYETEVRDQFFFCRAGIHIASVLADGSVTGCNNINHRYIQGNIYEQPFVEIWQSRFQLMRDRDWMKLGKCEKCKHFADCRGNGFHLRDENGELQFCHLEKLIS